MASHQQYTGNVVGLSPSVQIMSRVTKGISILRLKSNKIKDKRCAIEKIQNEFRQTDNDILSELQKFDVDLHRELDKRFDKIYQTLSEQKK